MPHFHIPQAGTPAYDEWLAATLSTPRSLVAKAIKPPRKPVVRREPDYSEPVQRPDEDWIRFARRWERSPYGRAKRAEAEALRQTIGVEHRAEQIRDARILDQQSNRRHGVVPSTVGHS